MRDVAVLCTIRTMAQTLCYDLARAEKAKDGKKDCDRRFDPEGIVVNGVENSELIKSFETSLQFPGQSWSILRRRYLKPPSKIP